MAEMSAEARASIEALTAELRAERLAREAKAAEDGIDTLEAAERLGRMQGLAVVRALGIEPGVELTPDQVTRLQFMLTALRGSWQ